MPTWAMMLLRLRCPLTWAFFFLQLPGSRAAEWSGVQELLWTQGYSFWFGLPLLTQKLAQNAGFLCIVFRVTFVSHFAYFTNELFVWFCFMEEKMGETRATQLWHMRCWVSSSRQHVCKACANWPTGWSVSRSKHLQNVNTTRTVTILHCLVKFFWE